MAPKIPENLSKNQLLGDFWSILVDFLAIWTDVKNDEILKPLQKAKKARKLTQGSPKGAIQAKRPAPQYRVFAGRVGKAPTRATKHEGKRLVASRKKGKKASRNGQ